MFWGLSVVNRLGLFAVLAAAPLLSACGAGTGVNNNLTASPERPGTSIKVANPNPQKWNNPVQPSGPRTANTRVYVCKPLACAGAAAVGILTGASPTRHPDRAALEKAAKLLPTQAKAQDMMMEAASEGDERQMSLSSKVTEARGYPAIVAEVKRTTRGKARYIMRGDLFIGTMLVKVISISTTREEAKRNFDEFVNVMDIADFEPPAPATVRADAPAAPAGDQPHPAFSGIR
jgi:hypothetical protein